MSFEWSDYLDLAQELASRSDVSSLKEALLRTATSRAYYSVFIQARNLLVSEGHVIPAVNTHRYVINQFLSSSSEIRKLIGADLERLQIARKRADYDNLS
jgi:uncharacterized protein (UPF0332 family)